MKTENGRDALRAWGELCYPSHLPKDKAWLLCPRVLGHGDLPWLYPAEGAVGLLQDLQALPRARGCVPWLKHGHRTIGGGFPLTALWRPSQHGPWWPLPLAPLGLHLWAHPLLWQGCPCLRHCQGLFLSQQQWQHLASLAPCMESCPNPTLHNCAQGFP